MSPDVLDNNLHEAEEAADERLDSWKEIAGYLKRESRTVRRWEKTQGLPVHRHLHKKRGTVYAYKRELDRWWNNGRARLEQQEQVWAAARSHRQVRVVAAGVLMTLLSVTAYFTWPRIRPERQAPVGKVMLAVLPLANLSGDAGQEYVNAGLTEGLTAQLGRIQPQQLTVIGRASTLHYKHSNKSVDQIGRELGVDYVLEGSVRREAQHVRINVRLIRTGDKTPLWSGSYDRGLGGLLQVQREIALSIAREIRVKLTPEEERRLGTNSATSPEAYEAYLKGRYVFWGMSGPNYHQRSIQYFNQAVKLDPGFVPVYAGLADTYSDAAWTSHLRPAEGYSHARGAAIKALELDPMLPEAHTSLGWVNLLYDWDWANAEHQFQEGVQLNPNSENVLFGYTYYLMVRGRFDEAIAVNKRLIALDPQLTLSKLWLIRAYIWADRNPEAEAYSKSLQQGPGLSVSRHFGLTNTYANEGKCSDALEEARETEKGLVNTALAEEPDVMELLGWVYGVCGQRNEALRLLKKLKQQKVVSPVRVAVLYAGLGEKNAAFQWLDKGLEERWPQAVTLGFDPRFDGLRSDPRFQSLLQRMNFPTAQPAHPPAS